MAFFANNPNFHHVHPKNLNLPTIAVALFVQAQPAPELTFEKKRFHLPFQQVNNLILVDLTINAQPYRFLLDTGVHHTLIFNPKFLDPAQNIKAQETTYLSISGLGKNEPIKAFRTVGNTTQIGKIKIEHQTILWLDEMDAPFYYNMSGIDLQYNGVK